MLANEIEECCRVTGWKRSQVIERLCLLGLNSFKVQYMKRIVEAKQEVKQEVKSETLEERYMRSRLFGRNYDSEWSEV
jgi:hypothetical protein